MTNPTAGFSNSRVSALTSSRQWLAIAPLVYVAWLDGTLDETERSELLALGGEEDGSDVLAAWTDPVNPPSGGELLALRSAVRQSIRADRDTVSLGQLLARLSGDETDDMHNRALKYVGNTGLNPDVAVREILGAVPRGVETTFGADTSTFNADAMRQQLEGADAPVHDRVREVLQDEAFFHLLNGTKEQDRAHVLDMLQALAARGIGSEAAPVSVGGQDDMRAFVRTFQTLAMHDLSLVVKFGVQFGLFGGSILFLGTEKHHERWLPGVGNLAVLGGFAMTESGHGSNVRDLETTATYDPETREFVVHTPSASARKEWIGNAAVDGRWMTVFAQLETAGERHGVHAFVVPVRDESGASLPGVAIEDCGHKMGLNGVDNGRLYFDKVRIPRENLLDRHGSVAEDGTYSSSIASENRRFFTMLGTLVGGRVSVAAASVTAAAKALAIAIRYGELRRQFGPEGAPEQRLMDYRTHQMRLLTGLARNVALNVAVTDLVARFTERDEEDTREVETLAAGIKAAATWHAIDASQMARECCGGQGFLTENQIARVRTDVDVFATFEGDNTVLLNLVAKNRLAGYARGFQQDLVTTLLRELSKRAATELREANPIITRSTDEEHLRGADLHVDLLELKAHNLMVSAARRVQKRTSGGMDAFDAFSEIQDHAMAFARSEVEAGIARAFRDFVENMPEGAEQDAAEALRQLAAVDLIYSDVGWFLENGYVRPDKARALRKLRIKLLDEVKPNALAWTDAFGIPDQALAAPIAYEEYVGRQPLNSRRAEH